MKHLIALVAGFILLSCASPRPSNGAKDLYGANGRLYGIYLMGSGSGQWNIYLPNPPRKSEVVLIQVRENVDYEWFTPEWYFDGDYAHVINDSDNLVGYEYQVIFASTNKGSMIDSKGLMPEPPPVDTSEQ